MADTFVVEEQRPETESDTGRYSTQAGGRLDIHSEDHIVHRQPEVVVPATPCVEEEGQKGLDMLVSVGVAGRIVPVVKAQSVQQKRPLIPDSTRLPHGAHLAQVFVVRGLVGDSNLAVVSVAVDVACQKL